MNIRFECKKKNIEAGNVFAHLQENYNWIAAFQCSLLLIHVILAWESLELRKGKGNQVYECVQEEEVILIGKGRIY